MRLLQSWMEVGGGTCATLREDAIYELNYSRSTQLKIKLLLGDEDGGHEKSRSGRTKRKCVPCIKGIVGKANYLKEKDKLPKTENAMPSLRKRLLC